VREENRGKRNHHHHHRRRRSERGHSHDNGNGGGRRTTKSSKKTGVGLRQKRTRTRTSLDLSILPLSKLIPSFPILPSTPTQLLALPPLPSLRPRSTSSSPSDASADFAPDARRLIVSSESLREYSWLLDIIHDHTAGLCRHSRLSQLGPYRLARVLEVMGVEGVMLGEADSGYCSSPAPTSPGMHGGTGG